MCQSWAQGGKRCDVNSTSRAKSLNATNKRIRRTKANLTKENVSDEQRKKLEDKLANDERLKESLIQNPENTKKSATTKTALQLKTEEALEEKRKSAEAAEDKTPNNVEKASNSAPVTSTPASPAPKEEKPKWDANGFDPKTGEHRTGGEFDPDTGLDIDGYDYNEFDTYGINRETGTKYNEDGLDRYGYDAYGNKDDNFYIPSFGHVDIEVDDVDLDEEFELEEDDAL